MNSHSSVVALSNYMSSTTGDPPTWQPAGNGWGTPQQYGFQQPQSTTSSIVEIVSQYDQFPSLEAAEEVLSALRRMFIELQADQPRVEYNPTTKAAIREVLNDASRLILRMHKIMGVDDEEDND
jgi:hypothetical protein